MARFSFVLDDLHVSVTNADADNPLVLIGDDVGTVCVSLDQLDALAYRVRREMMDSNPDMDPAWDDVAIAARCSP